MAVNKVLEATSLSIEVEHGTDKTGAKIYRKKAFSGVKPTAPAENVYAVAEAIKGVLNAGTRNSFVNESSKLVNA